MRQLSAFVKKEFLEFGRTGKVTILLIIFAIFGILNPAFAKLTPWLYEMLASTMKEQGITIGAVTVTAMTAWEQYYKNLMMEFIVFIILFCGTLTSEYQKGTLINMLTKGLPRWKVVAAKGFALLCYWSLSFWLCFGITYGYALYFWDNAVAAHIGLAALYSWLFGVWLLSLIVVFSVFLTTGPSVLLATGLVYALCSLLGMLPTVSDYLPTKLTAGLDLLKGVASPAEFAPAAAVTAALIVICALVSVPVFNRRKL